MLGEDHFGTARVVQSSRGFTTQIGVVVASKSLRYLALYSGEANEASADYSRRFALLTLHAPHDFHIQPTMHCMAMIFQFSVLFGGFSRVLPLYVHFFWAAKKKKKDDSPHALSFRRF
jgi:hypothetical protein